jgi:MFS superfamily sulfate permease-like transporter
MSRADLFAGIAVAGLLLPEAVAYAGIAGLVPGRAVLAAIAGCLVYALVGRSRFAIVAPTSSSAAILAAALGAMGADAATRDLLATATVGLTGLLFLIAATLKLGGLTSFIARPVLRGFAFGLAVTIVLRQLPELVGVHIIAPDIFRLGVGLFAALPEWNWASLATGVVALICLLGFRRLPSIPGALLVLIGGIVASLLMNLPAYGVATMGKIDLRLALPRLPSLSFATLSSLAQLTVPLALILFAESWGAMRALALRHDDSLAPDRELGALGLVNLAAAAVQGMPVGAGLSAASANEAAGATSRLASIVAGLSLLLLLLFGTKPIALLPRPVLAAVVIAALTEALNPSPLVRLWRLGRDHYVALAATLGVLAFGVVNGMLLAIALSLAALIRNLAAPHLIELGQLDGGHNYVDLARHPEAERPAGIAIWRPAEPLFFANAERILAHLERRLRGSHELRALVVSLEASVDIDSTALDLLIEFDQRIAARGVHLHLARVHDRVRDCFTAAGADTLVERSFFSVDDAVTAIRKER